MAESKQVLQAETDYNLKALTNTRSAQKGLMDSDDGNA